MKKKNKKGGDEEPDIIEKVDSVDTSSEVTSGNVTLAKDDEYNEFEGGKGGTRKRRGNGHKATCKCPICKNMKKKTRRHRKRSQRRR